jgi:hypothetical protein
MKGLLVAAALPASIAVFEDRHFTFCSIEDTADVFLVRKHHHQRHHYGENAVQAFLSH